MLGQIQYSQESTLNEVFLSCKQLELDLELFYVEFVSCEK